MNLTQTTLIVLTITLSCAVAVCATEVEYLNSPATEALNLPFSEAVRVDHMLYLSGHLGNLPGKMELAPGGIAGQTKQALENIKGVLERHGSSLDKVVKCTVFMADMREWPQMNEIYRTYFTTAPPARSALGTSGLGLGAQVGIECIAVIE